MNNEAMQRLLDRADIHDCLCRYARGVDRGDWDLVRSTYHDDAHDQHGDYSGDIDGLIRWLEVRFCSVDNSMHFLGNSLIEFITPDKAFVETYFVSRRFREPATGELEGLRSEDRLCREAWGRYVDQFEKRQGQWRVQKRIVVLETAGSYVAMHGERRTGGGLTWGLRNRDDDSCRVRDMLFSSVNADFSEKK